MTACTQPGCSGTFVDDYCDVCGRPASASTSVPARALHQSTGCGQPGCTGTIIDDNCDICGTAARAPDAVSARTAAEGAAATGASPTPTTRSVLTAIRRAVGVGAVLSLLACAVVFYRVAPGYSTSGSSPRTGGSSSASSDPTTVGKPRASDTADSNPADEAIQVEGLVNSAKPFQPVRIEGTHHGRADTFLQVQRWDAGRWVPFPLPTKTDQSGKFTAYVEPGPPGRYRLRVLDPTSGAESEPFVLVIKA